VGHRGADYFEFFPFGLSEERNVTNCSLQLFNFPQLSETNYILKLTWTFPVSHKLFRNLMAARRQKTSPLLKIRFTALI
jgi:hypothetical protein